jgi:imidazolonepropionase-like amidohydrolase
MAALRCDPGAVYSNDNGATVIDAKRKVLIPGLIDAYWHTMYASGTPVSSSGVPGGFASGDSIVKQIKRAFQI